jgi:hypothetical protein
VTPRRLQAKDLPSQLQTAKKECSVCDRDKAFLRRSRRPDYESPCPAARVVDLFCGCGGFSLGVAEAARRFIKDITVDRLWLATRAALGCFVSLYTEYLPKLYLL